MTHQPERRGNPRFATYLQTFVASGREEGPAVLADVSAVGALLAQTELRPELGAPVRLSVILRSEQILHAMGKVVRQTEQGFAIQFDTPKPDLYNAVIEDAASVKESS